MQSDGTISPVSGWKSCMTLHHMCILHTRAGVTIKALNSACLDTFFSNTSPSLLPFTLSLYLPIHHFCFCVFVCACMRMTSIWWIKSNALILSQTRPLLHVRCEMPLCGKPHPSRMSSRATGETMQQQASFLLTLVCPKNNKLSSSTLAAHM